MLLSNVAIAWMELESTTGGINVRHTLKKKTGLTVFFRFVLIWSFCCCFWLLVCCCFCFGLFQYLYYQHHRIYNSREIDYFRLLPLIPLNGENNNFVLLSNQEFEFLNLSLPLSRSRPVDNAISPETSNRKPLTKKTAYFLRRLVYLLFG